MSEEFKAITIESQEQMDSLFKDRLNRQEEKHRKEIADIKAGFSDYEELKTKASDSSKEIETLKGQLKEANDKLIEHDSLMAEKDKKIKDFEIDAMKTKVISEMGLSFEAKSFLQGEDEEAISKSAESLKNLVGKNRTAPMASHEPSGNGGDLTKAAYSQLANSLS